jgi:hypothetical protein
VNRAIEGSFTGAGRTADHLANLETTAEQQRGRRGRVMVASSVVVDAHENIFEHAPRFEVIEKSAEADVEGGQ